MAESQGALSDVIRRCARLNTRVQVRDGRVGTVCYNNLEGVGGVWGRHTFEMPHGGCGDLPEPEFLLRDSSLARLFPGRECVGIDVKVIHD